MTATRTTTADRRSGAATAIRIGTALVTASLLAVALGLAVMVATGHRPIIITTGSMRPTAPPGTLIVAGPKPGAEVVAGDVVVMRRPGSTPVTHRVVEIVDDSGIRAAITQGDANDFLDPAPYLLGEGDELVARWYFPRLGGAVEWLGSSRGATVLVAFVLLILTSIALRRIWAEPDDEDGGEDATGSDGHLDWADEAPWPADDEQAVQVVRPPARSGGVL
ncbi:MAG: signal peptidase I [Actinomycetota bacterium]